MIDRVSWLGNRGWAVEEFWDICWLDCPRPGYLLVAGDRCICLCLDHAMRLQAGCWAGDYDGAALPPESRATSWPWQAVTMRAA